MMALAGQSLHGPSSLRRCRSSAASTPLSSRFCSSVRRGFAGLVADLWLAVPARVLRPGLVCFGFLGRVLPVLAGLGRMKLNSRVPPNARVCGGTFARRRRQIPTVAKLPATPMATVSSGKNRHDRSTPNCASAYSRVPARKNIRAATGTAQAQPVSRPEARETPGIRWAHTRPVATDSSGKKRKAPGMASNRLAMGSSMVHLRRVGHRVCLGTGE